MTLEKSPVALLIESVNADDAAQVRSLFERFPEQRSEFTPFAGGTWLHYAAKRGSNAVIEYLLSSNTDINVGDRWDGANALCFAAQENRVESVKLLIENGIFIDTSAPVKNPLFSAVVGQSPEIVGLLLKSGIDTTVKYNSETMRDMDAVAFALMRGEQKCAEIIARWNSGGDDIAARQMLVEADKVAERNAQA